MPAQNEISSRASPSMIDDGSMNEPWAPIVLSLDGGGIKGLSELFILRRIMERIKEKIEEDRKNGVPYADPISLIISPGRSDVKCPELLPCYFFDYMVGTSTGGLIAVMLGRLRMSVDDAIKAYWNLGANIFPPRVILPSQRRERLKRAINSVIESHCLCHQAGGPCVGEQEELRQHDYAEFDDASYKKDKSTRNLTCKAALVTQKRGGDSNEVYLFRTYNNTTNKPGIQNIPNQKLLDKAKLAIWKACCASTASRKHFGVMVIKGAQYIDGGADNNNPSGIALDEARAMSRSTEPKVAAMISLGCGEKMKPGWLGGSPFTIATLKALTRRVTDTEKMHQNTMKACQQAGTPYFRFNVKPYQGNSGLKKIKMDHCKKKSKKPWWMFGGQRQIPDEKEMPPWYIDLQSETGRSNSDNHNSDVSPGSKPDQQQRSEFDSDKYFYSTYNTIFMETMKYCGIRDVGRHEQKVEAEIDRCAEVLLEYARARHRDHSERWKCFISHPDPRHPQYMTSGYRRNGDEP